jgi:hypothetical protein
MYKYRVSFSYIQGKQPETIWIMYLGKAVELDVATMTLGFRWPTNENEIRSKFTGTNPNIRIAIKEIK